MSEAPAQKSGSAPNGDQEKTVRINMDLVSSDRTVALADRTVALTDRSTAEFPGSKNGDGNIPKLTPKPQEKYIFRKSIGRGGMKMVIQVKDRDTMRDIAMAVFPDAANRPAADLRRFIDEARITASLEHPNIVPVHDIGIDATGAPYFTMKLLRGETLASVLKKLDAGDPEYKKLYTLPALLRIFNRVCDAVAFAHSKGVIHLDLKPENIQIGDFGEVLLMDFGLAKIISKADEDEQKEAPVYTNQTYIPGVTVDGITKGTPGYMAPEQAAGKNSLKDFRSDVYSLGAILYSIATYQNPLADQSNMKQMMLDTVNGNIIPPQERAPERMIPNGLDAVIRKAMSVRLPSRYQSVKELRDEIRAFLAGFPTQAEKAGLVKQFLLFIRRNKITFPAITLSIFLLLVITFYAIQDSAKRKTGWSELYKDVYTDQNISAENHAFYNSTLFVKVPAWGMSAQGLHMRSGEWFFLEKMNMGAGQRVVLKYIPTKGSSLKISLHTGLEPLDYAWENPVGYTVVLSAFGGALDLIYRNEKKGLGTILVSSDTGIVPGELNTIVIERDSEHFSVKVNDEEILEATDLFPLKTGNVGSFGVRADGDGVILQSLDLSRLVLPEKASPLIAADVLLERNYYLDAVEQYMIIADNYESGPIADRALAKAYVAASTFIEDKGKRDGICDSIRKKLKPRMSKFVYRQLILETDAVTYWKDGKYSLALKVLEQLFKETPSTTVMLKILQLPHKKLPPAVAEAMLDYIARNTRLTRLDLSGFGITSLKKLNNMGLRFLNCSGNQLTSLEGLEKMPLEFLNCSNNRITSLEPLRYIAIKTLSCSHNRISSLEPVNMSRLMALDVSFNALTDLNHISGKELNTLRVRGNKITSLVPLSGLPLRVLDAGQTEVSDLSPLRGMPLENLLLDHTAIADLSTIQDIKFISLSLYNCKQLKDLRPLFNMTSLRSLSLPQEHGDISPLRALPNLLFITSSGIVPKGDTGTAAAFWQVYDKKSSGKKKK